MIVFTLEKMIKFLFSHFFKKLFLSFDILFRSRGRSIQEYSKPCDWIRHVQHVESQDFLFMSTKSNVLDEGLKLSVVSFFLVGNVR